MLRRQLAEEQPQNDRWRRSPPVAESNAIMIGREQQVWNPKTL